jgi:hypothetical protein
LDIRWGCKNIFQVIPQESTSWILLVVKLPKKALESRIGEGIFPP